MDRSINEALADVMHPAALPDLFCVSDLGTWTAIKGTDLGSYRLLRENLWEWHKPEPPLIQGGYFVHQRLNRDSEELLTPLGTMIANLITRLGRERPELQEIAEYYRDVGIAGFTNGTARSWPFSLYSPQVQERLSIELQIHRPNLKPEELILWVLNPAQTHEKGEWAPLFP